MYSQHSVEERGYYQLLYHRRRACSCTLSSLAKTSSGTESNSQTTKIQTDAWGNGTPGGLARKGHGDRIPPQQFHGHLIARGYHRIFAYWNISVLYYGVKSGVRMKSRVEGRGEDLDVWRFVDRSPELIKYTNCCTRSMCCKPCTLTLWVKSMCDRRKHAGIIGKPASKPRNGCPSHRRKNAAGRTNYCEARWLTH